VRKSPFNANLYSALDYAVEKTSVPQEALDMLMRAGAVVSMCKSNAIMYR